jgi:hypothetical protein
LKMTMPYNGLREVPYMHLRPLGWPDIHVLMMCLYSPTIYIYIAYVLE